MKKCIFILTMFVVMCSNAQNILFSKDQTWSVLEYHVLPELAKDGCYCICKFFFNDSVIYKGNMYQRIYVSLGNSKYSIYTGQAFRYDNGKVLLYYEDRELEEELIEFYGVYNDRLFFLFDENFEAGTTHARSTFTMITDSVFTDGGTSRKCWWANNYSVKGIYGKLIHWIEGIGNFECGICNIWSMWPMNSRFYSLLSCERNGDTIYVNSEVKMYYEELLASTVKEIQDDTPVVRTDYYDLDGRYLQSPLPNGISIEKCFYGDGTVKTKKVINK